MKIAYNLDEFNISSFCINSMKAINKDNNKFILFKQVLQTFHDIEEIYEDTFYSYCAFITYSVIKDSLIKDKNILTYEAYVYNILDGFYSQKYNKKINTKEVAKVWTNIVFIFNTIIEKSSNPDYKAIQKFENLFTSFTHLNTKVSNSSYQYSVPLLFEKESGYDAFIIIPSLKNNYFNIVIPFLLKYFKNKIHNIFIIDLSLTSLSFNYTEIAINNVLLNSYRKYLDTLFIDFNKINFQNCGICQLSCTRQELLNFRYVPQPFLKNRKVIQTVNI